MITIYYCAALFWDSRVVILLSSVTCLQSAAGRVRSFPDLLVSYTSLITSVSSVQHNWAHLTLAYILCHFLEDQLGFFTRSWAGFQDMNENLARFLKVQPQNGLHHFCCILLVKARHRTSPDSEWGIDKWQELHSHIAKGNEQREGNICNQFC